MPDKIRVIFLIVILGLKFAFPSLEKELMPEVLSQGQEEFRQPSLAACERSYYFLLSLQGSLQGSLQSHWHFQTVLVLQTSPLLSTRCFSHGSSKCLKP